MKNLLVLTMIFPLTACAVIWGVPYKVEQVTPTSITIIYDPDATTGAAIEDVARTHCDQYGKDATPGESSKSGWGPVTQTFNCGKRATL
jgi:hypothetical protein